MAHYLTFDVVDRPDGGVRSLRRELGRRRHGSGAVTGFACATFEFNTTLLPHPTPRRLALAAVWASMADAERGRRVLLDGVSAREHWRVLAEVTRARTTAPWHGWAPIADGSTPLGSEEPVLVVIQGLIHPRHLPKFVAAGRGVTTQARSAPGFLGGLGISASVTETTSVSCWRTMREAREFAFRMGAHADAISADREAQWHHQECFLQLRPLYSDGTLRGVAPFDGMLPAAV